MTVTPQGGAVAASLLRAASGGLTAARRHRVELLRSIHAFESAIAAPAGEPDWRQQVAGRLAELRQAFAEHIAVTEGEDGLYAELLLAAPRLARQVGRLVREHSMLARALDTYASRLSEPDLAIERLRAWASDLLRELSRHRQRGADLVYEAYATDIGGET